MSRIGGRHQAVVDDDVGLLHQSQGPECQQIRIARTGADQIDLAAADVVLGTVLDHVLELRLGLDITPRKHHFGNRRQEHFFPEGAPLLRPDRCADRVLVARSQRAQASIGGGNQGFQPRPQHAREHGRFTAAGDRHHDGRTVDDGGQDETTQRRLVRHVDRDVPGTRGVGDDFGGGCILLDHDQRILAVEQFGAEAVGDAAQVVRMRQSREALMQVGRGHLDARTGTQQEFCLAGGSLGPPDDQAGAIAKIEKNGQVIHQAYPAVPDSESAPDPDSAEYGGMKMKRMSPGLISTKSSVTPCR